MTGPAFALRLDLGATPHRDSAAQPEATARPTPRSTPQSGRRPIASAARQDRQRQTLTNRNTATQRASITPCTLLTVDVEGSSALSNPDKLTAQHDMYALLEESFRRSSLSWDECSHEDRGDGVLVVLGDTAAKLPLVDSLVPCFASLLAQRNRTCRGPRLRMRLAIHAGDAHRTSRGWLGTDVDLVFGLVNAQPVRDMLTTAHRSSSVVVVSGSVHQSIISHGYGRIDPGSWTPVAVRTKRQEEAAWIHVPGYPRPPHLAPIDRKPLPPRPSHAWEHGPLPLVAASALLTPDMRVALTGDKRTD